MLRVNAAVYPYWKNSIWGPLWDVSCLYSGKRVMLRTVPTNSKVFVPWFMIMQEM